MDNAYLVKGGFEPATVKNWNDITEFEVASSTQYDEQAISSFKPVVYHSFDNPQTQVSDEGGYIEKMYFTNLVSGKLIQYKILIIYTEYNII